MSIRLPLILSILGFSAGFVSSSIAGYSPSNSKPPDPPREFRGAWIATVHNIDWPSRPGLSPARQREELIKHFDTAARVGLNAIILQVRPEGDAVYASGIEPWSYWLTGKMGRAPTDGYDPLKFAVNEAHRRGLELHAWFNPFRARATRSVSAAVNHMTNTHPAWMLPAGSQVWANPGLREVQERAIAVMVDVTRRYRVDGIHIDDYFYPYPKKIGGRMVPQFDDSTLFTSYRAGGGKLSVEDWRRAEMNGFIERLYRSIKQTKPWVKFGVSPFGIWRPGHPKGIEADLDSFFHLAADSRTWLQKGWVDYLSPQLYWRIDDKPHSFTALTKWWADQNPRARHLWPGIASSRILSDTDKGRPASESFKQVEVTRKHGATKQGAGHLHWSFKAIADNRGGLQEQLAAAYRIPAIPPASPWIAPPQEPPRPVVSVDETNERADIRIPSRDAVLWRLIQVRLEADGDWVTLRLQSGGVTVLPLSNAPAEISVRNVGYGGRLSAAAVFKRG